ncbi:hypothetical protein UFOVP555_24 [uncultured Caudovirales phage]|uniref:Uncharacterized protein n=1 Tax=uncultured Caudovirales phage TaxID=2100421 RepID=A0A6J5MRD5_9CAUD|nr:hypothetical protein UFOVP555_24 [uncultured Caudovirales phage]
MCSSKPKAPKVETPPPPQAAQAAINVDPKRRNNTGVNNTGAFASAPGGTLLTGPGGAGAVTTGKSTLLGN